MRSVVPVAILVLTSVLMAGCAKDDGEGDLHYVCANGTEIHADDHPEANATEAEDLAKFCARSSTTGSRSNTTSQAPNVLPTLVVNVTDDGGNATVVTMIDGNLTFSAAGSTDSDGTIAGIAVTVTDSNTTRTATLYDAAKKAFKSATFRFDRAGPVNVTVAMVDDRAGFTVNQTHVYVNHLQTLGPKTVLIPADGVVPGVVPGTSACNGGDPLTSAQYYTEMRFDVASHASFVEATASTTGLDTGPAGALPSGASITICSPSKEALSDSGETVATRPDATLPPPVGTQSYYIGVYATFPQSSVAVDVLVHYEPRAAA